jgi:thiamine monophosphate kinase
VLAAAEDYQLIFTAPPTATEQLLQCQLAPLVRLGSVTAPEDGCHYRAETGDFKPLITLGFEHLQGG